MNCFECKKELQDSQYKKSISTLGVALCDRHTSLILNLMAANNTPKEAVQLYFGLKAAGIKPTLEWWDGSKFVDLSISRVKLNIEIDTNYQRITHQQAIKDLEKAMNSFKNGFTTIRIPHVLIKYYLNETVDNILGIMEGLKANVKLVQRV
ncbi:hypothetical protein U1E44_15260 [Arenibacter sp. GZD96]|uniref:hypothetical protein n=1 Tax=Aurantibrevibacter litoralis TaxID=3106030 RepID=UPI002B00391A|nr:hypothetical protein [Arenibacter sp. GZD-96]MEA1787459.1 hypothetical protein [Arenibacter sp. GZD-96]